MRPKMLRNSQPCRLLILGGCHHDANTIASAVRRAEAYPDSSTYLIELWCEARREAQTPGLERADKSIVFIGPR